jgi:hypothetical protein
MRFIFCLIIVLVSSCFRQKKTLLQKQPVEFNLKIISLIDSNIEHDTYKYCALSYEIRNNTSAIIFFNKMNFSETITDTNGTKYKKGYFNILGGAERYKQGCQYCKVGIDFDIYPINKFDTLSNIIKLNAGSYYSDTLRAYGYDFIYDEKKKEAIPFCFKKEPNNKAVIKFQVLYDNTMEDVRADTIWKGTLLSNEVIWK